MAVNSGQIERAANAILGGGIVAFPTETVYGLGANAFDERAVARVFEAKRRPRFDPLILHVGGREWIAGLAASVPRAAAELMDSLWPGPLSVVLPKKSCVPDIATAGLKGVALRMPSSDIALSLIRAVGVPIAAPSANLFGAVSPTTAEHVQSMLGGLVDMIIDGGECTVGVESTIVSFMGSEPVLLRPGGTPLEEIERIVGKVAVPDHTEMVNQSPGRGGAHYAASVPMVQVGGVGEVCGINNIGLLALSPQDIPDPSAIPTCVTSIEYLSAAGDLREAACRLFAAIRRLDAAGVDAIVALPVPKEGLGLAINDRLFRASMKSNCPGECRRG